MIKKFILIVFVLGLIFTFTLNFSFVYATGTFSEVISGADSFIESAKNKVETNKDQINLENMKNTSSIIYNILLISAVLISVLIGIIMGLKMVTGGIEGKVEVKQMLTPYIVGNVVVFGAFGIWKIAVEVIKTLN